VPLPRRLVVKLGSNLLTDRRGQLDVRFLRRMVGELADLHAQGRDLVVVSSGAVAAGRPAFASLASRHDIPARQMLAAVGQVRLMGAYARLFGRRGITVGQALLARSDIAERQGYLNARLALLGLLERRMVPIINENDVVAIDEESTKKSGGQAARAAGAGVCTGRKLGYQVRNVFSHSSLSTCVRTWRSR